MTATEFDVFRWRTEKLIRLVEANGPDTRLRIVEWQVSSDNETFFSYDESQFASTIHKMITTSCIYTCIEQHMSLRISTDILQENVGQVDGPSVWLDKLNFYHTHEQCSVNDLHCSNLNSCNESLQKIEMPEIHESVHPVNDNMPMNYMRNHMSVENPYMPINSTQNQRPSLSHRTMAARSSYFWANVTTPPADRPLTAYSSLQTQLYSMESEVPLDEIQWRETYRVPPQAEQHQVHERRGMSQFSARYLETYPDDDPAFDDMPELA